MHPTRPWCLQLNAVIPKGEQVEIPTPDVNPKNYLAGVLDLRTDLITHCVWWRKRTVCFLMPQDLNLACNFRLRRRLIGIISPLVSLITPFPPLLYSIL